MAQDVICEVKSCHYNDEGNKCTADSIYVINQIDGQAHTSNETDCKTFQQKM